MILIGQYDSPFVRRVAVALQIYGLAYEHRPWSTFSDAERLAQVNPLCRVPTFIADDGLVLVESGAILDYLDELAGEGNALVARHGPDRRAVLRICALATGLCDKLVSLVYERNLHQVTSEVWIARCESQIRAVLDALEADRASRPQTYWSGDRLSHADIAVTCAMRFLGEAHGELNDPGRWPQLTAAAHRCELMDAFGAVVQPFIPPQR